MNAARSKNLAIANQRAFFFASANGFDSAFIWAASIPAFDTGWAGLARIQASFPGSLVKRSGPYKGDAELGRRVVPETRISYRP